MGYIIRAWTAHIIKCVNKFGSFHLHDIEAPPFSLSFQIYVDSDVVDISNQLVYDPLALLNGRGAIMSWLGNLQPIHCHIIVRSCVAGFVAFSEMYVFHGSMVQYMHLHLELDTLALWNPSCIRHSWLHLFSVAFAVSCNAIRLPLIGVALVPLSF